MPENRLLLDKDKYPTASVFVRVRGNTQLQPQSINSIRFLVANSVEGLKPNHVTVVDNLGNVLSENSDDDSVAGLSSSQLVARRNLEQYLARKAQDMLEKVLGPGQAIVRVSAEINYDSTTKTEENFDPDGQVVRTQTKNDENNDSSTTGGNNSPVGITVNASTSTNSASAGAAALNTTQNRKTTSTVEYEIGKTTSSIVQAAGGIKHLSAAVTVAAQVQGTGEDRKVINRTADELTRLRTVVASALGVDPSRGDTITLEELPFNDQYATDLTHELDQQQQREYWWNLARNLVYPGLGLLALIVLFRLFQRTPVQDIPIGVPVGRLMALTRSAAMATATATCRGRANWRLRPRPASSRWTCLTG